MACRIFMPDTFVLLYVLVVVVVGGVLPPPAGAYPSRGGVLAAGDASGRFGGRR